MERIPDDELIGAYLDDELSSEERARAERLLVERADLRRLLEELRAVREGLRSLPSYQLEEDFGAAVLRRAEKEMLRERPAALGNTALDNTEIDNSSANNRTEVPAIAEGAEQPAGDPQPAPAQPVPARSPVMPASVVASSESLVAREHASGGAPADPFARWRRPVIWSIVAAAAAVVLMFVPPRTVDRREDYALAPNRAPEATQQAVQGQAAPSDSDARRSAGAPGSETHDRHETAKAEGSRLGDARFEVSKSKDGASNYGTVRNGAVLNDTAKNDAVMSGPGGTTPAGPIPAVRLPETDPLAAKKVLERAAASNRPISPLEMESQSGGSYGNQYARQLAEDQKRGQELVEKLQSLSETPGQREQLAEPLQRRLAAGYAAGPASTGDQVLIVEINCLPGAIENAFMPSLARNKVIDFSGPAADSLATSQMADPVAGRGVTGLGVTDPASTTPVAKAPSETAPVAGVPLATNPLTKSPSTTVPAGSSQSNSGIPAKAGDKYGAKAPAADLAGVADEKKQRTPGEGQAVELRKSLVAGEEYYYVVADAGQLERLLNEISSDRRNFASVRVEPAPSIETQQALNQYSRQKPDDASRLPASNATTSGAGAAKPALKYGPGALGDIAGPATAPSTPSSSTPVPAGAPAVPATAASPSAASHPAASQTAVAPKAAPQTAAPKAGSGAPTSSIAAPASAPGQTADGKEKTAGQESATNETLTTRSMPGQPVAKPAGAPVDSPIANVTAPAAVAVPSLAAPSADSYELSLTVPQSRALRFRQEDLSVLRELERVRGTDPTQAGRELDDLAGRRMNLGNAGNREEPLGQGKVAAGGAGVGGAGPRPTEPERRSGMAGTATTSPAPSAESPRVVSAAPAVVPSTPSAAASAPAAVPPTRGVVSGASPAPAAVAGAPMAAPSAPMAQVPSSGAGLPPAMGGGGTALGKKADQVPANIRIALTGSPPAGPPSSATPSASQTAATPAAAPVPPPTAVAQPAPASRPSSSAPGSTAMPEDNRPGAFGAIGQSAAPVGGSVLPYGALRSETNLSSDGQQAATDALRRSGGRQEAIFIFRVVREGEPNSAYGDAFNVAKERPAAAPAESKPAAESPVPTSSPPLKKGG